MLQIRNSILLNRILKAVSSINNICQCGWLKDKFGLSWQIIPKTLGELMSDPDQEKTARVMQAMLKMKKIEIAKLQEAYEGK